MPNPIDLPQVLAVLRPSEDWGPLAQTGVDYATFAAKWRGASAVPTLAQMQVTWDSLEAGRAVADRDALRAAAVTLATAQDRTAQLIRAELMLTMDELNLLRQWVTSFKAAVAAATTLADLKARVAALASTPDRTAAQIKPALVARVATPDAD